MPQKIATGSAIKKEIVSWTRIRIMATLGLICQANGRHTFLYLSIAITKRPKAQPQTVNMLKKDLILHTRGTGYTYQKVWVTISPGKVVSVLVVSINDRHNTKYLKLHL